MKQLRNLSFLLVLCLLFSALSSCGFLITDPSVEQDGTKPVTAPITQTPSLGGSDADLLSYTLTQKTLDEFYGMLSDCEALFLGEAREEETLQASLDALEDAYYHIATQAQIAYILYCVKQNDEVLSQNYLFSSAASSDAYAAYNESCKRIDASNAPNRAFFFRDWTEEEIAEMRGFSDEIVRYQKANDEILIQYRALNDENFSQKAHLYYADLLQNNNAIARLEGYQNYWVYANAEVYGRDADSYTASMRRYVKQYLVPLMNEVAIEFNAAYAALSEKERETVGAILQSDYAAVGVRYVDGYLETFDGEAEQDMKSMLQSENSVFTDSEDSYKGAFTGFLYEYERPICYFGPGYANTLTVIHEMGHYYAALEKGDMSLSIDLAEVHSQGNEWLFLSYMEDVLGARISKTLTLYQLYSSLSVVIRATMIDDFEERCYQQAQPYWGAYQFDNVMKDVINAYGGEEWMESLYSYWRYVVIESPVYYISYAVSMLAALQLYGIAEEDSFTAGQAAFLSLVQSAAEDQGFAEALAAAGLLGVGEERTYQLICRLAEKG